MELNHPHCVPGEHYVPMLALRTRHFSLLLFLRNIVGIRWRANLFLGTILRVHCIVCGALAASQDVSITARPGEPGVHA